MTKKELRAQCRSIVNIQRKKEGLTWKQGEKLFRTLWATMEPKLTNGQLKD